MPNTKLSAQFLNKNLEPGRYYDNSGVGLQLHVRTTGSKAFVQRLRLNGKYIDIGLGGYPATSLAEARRIAAENKILATKELIRALPKLNQLSFPHLRQFPRNFWKLS